MIDKNYIMSDAQAISITDTTVASTNVVDLGALVNDRGTALTYFSNEDGKVWIHVNVNTAFSAGTTLKATVQSSSDDAVADAFATLDPVIESSAIALASLTAGRSMIEVALPPDTERYLRILYTATGAIDGGKVDAFLTVGRQSLAG